MKGTFRRSAFIGHLHRTTIDAYNDLSVFNNIVEYSLYVSSNIYLNTQELQATTRSAIHAPTQPTAHCN